MDWILSLLTLIALGAPTNILIFDRALDVPFRRTIKTIGIPSIILLIVIVTYAALVKSPILSLLFWGFISGLLATVALDAVRLLGVRLGAFPLDMPVMFGLISLGRAERLPKNVMASMVKMLSSMPDEMRRQIMEPRIKAFAKLSPYERRLVVSMMVNGMNKLPDSERDKVMKTQLEILSSLSPDERSNMMKTMDELVLGIRHSTEEKPVSLMRIFREGRIPKIPMHMARLLLREAIPVTCSETGISLAKVKFAGYLWHFINGATYGMAYTLLFGTGSWLWAIAWGIFVDLIMMIVMPPMMPMIKLPYPRFCVVPYLAHIAMAIPIGYFSITYIPNEVTRISSILGSLLMVGDTSFNLMTLPIIAIIIMTVIIFLGYKVYTRLIKDYIS